MKRSELIFNIVSIPVDIISLTLAGLVSFYIRLAISSRFPILFVPDLNQFLKNFEMAVLVVLFIFAFAGLYNLRGTRKFTVEFRKVTAAVSTALLLIILVFFFNQSFFNSRLIVLIAWPVSILFVVFGRYLLKSFQAQLLSHGYGLHNIVVISSNDRYSEILKATIYQPKFGYKIIAEIPYDQKVIQALEDIFQPNKFEEILQAYPLASPEINAEIVEFARNRGLVFNYIPNLFDVQMQHVRTEEIRGIPLISIKNTPLAGWGKVLKRIFDIIVSLICLIITSPLFIIIGIAIKLDSQGKILYSAPRGGQKKDFTFYKFRTMYNHLSIGAEYGGDQAEKMRNDLWKQNVRGGEQGAFLKIKHDPRVTRVGRILRKTKLDEIPQFFNVLKGDMSMVGPRAHVIDEVERYREKNRRIFSIKPGIFGLSQIAQISWPDLPFEEEIRLNTFYIENWGLWMDILILAKSFYYLFFGRKSREDY